MFSFSYIWPIALVILSNIVYNVCTKSVPNNANPFASLTITYLVGAAVSAILFFVLGDQPNIFKEFGKMNWSSLILGLVIVGLEAGYIYAYKAGWQVSTASIVQSSILAVALIVVGALFYHENITWNKIVGIAVCAVGLVFINLK